MPSATWEKRTVGRKKKETPSDYVSVKIPRDVYLNAKIVATLQGREIAQVIGDVAREAIARLAEAEFKAAKTPKR